MDDIDIEKLYAIFQEHPVVTTDSRDCPAGSVFFALKGANFDGNKFAASAIEKGCSYAVVDDPEYAQDGRFIVVADCLLALKALARHHRRTLATPVIGITGTNGKTTTKELTAAVLGEKFNVLYTEGNLNNDIGVPKTLLRLRPEHEIAVVEMGASHPGDIQALVCVAEPDFGIITNVGRAHLQGFGSLEGVIHTKGELYDFLRTKDGAKVFLDNDNDHLKGIAAGLDTVTYGCTDDESLYVSGRVTSCSPMLNFTWKSRTGQPHDVDTHLIGSYNIKNMLAAAAIGLYFGVSEEQVCHALSSYTPSNNRSQLDITAHNKLIVDAYNANPTSMLAALQNFRNMTVGPKMAILGDMRELGEVSLEEHQKIADFLGDAGLDEVWLVGEEFAKTDCAFRKFRDVEQVKDAIRQQMPENRYILIKGSNGIRLFQLPELL